MFIIKLVNKCFKIHLFFIKINCFNKEEIKNYNEHQYVEIKLKRLI